uniref:ARAD1C24750p n=1 Tax=Blastobotrys adeninivorans TaxID=409370 RepID=A0A060T1Y1_BLAAD
MFRPKSKTPGLTPLNLNPPSTLKRPLAVRDDNEQADGSLRRFAVMIRKPSTKKHKTWEDDGFLVIKPDGIAILKDPNQRFIAKGKLSPNSIEIDAVVSIGGKEVLLESELSEPPKETQKVVSVQTLPTRPTSQPKLESPVIKKNPLKGTFVTPFSANEETQDYDPSERDTYLLPRPRGGGNADTVDVIIDPIIGRRLRPHQIEGVKFMYECVMGYRPNNNGLGVLLADEMGLGKTLMTITLLWTLFKQSPIKSATSVIRRAVIVCPVTLVENWKREFKKWLGVLRLKVFALGPKDNIRDFLSSHVYHVLIIGYDRLRTVASEMADSTIDIIVCDEAQRLKNLDSKSSKAITSLGATRRVMLSGTPIQNNLSEFFAMAEFLNPGILGTAAEFKREYEVPILRGQEPQASMKHREKGKEKLDQLIGFTRNFVLRRTVQDTLTQFLPPKRDTVIFCLPAKEQERIYSDMCNSSDILNSIESTQFSVHLEAITKLRKVCNTPLLVEKTLPLTSSLHSGKMAILNRMVKQISSTTDEKIVIVSGSTKVLALIAQNLARWDLRYCQLDGSTPSNQRQGIVDHFNKSPASDCFAFLLSVRSGGTGLNLIGASRLFLYDTDWNPAVDEQAMARIHREGQKRPVYIYRLLTVGMIDEKIYQRQITKKSLANHFMSEDNDSFGTGGPTLGSNSFTADELRDLFTMATDTYSHTHDLLGCTCLKDGCVKIEDDESDDEQSEQEELGGWTSALAVAKEGIFVPKRMRASQRMKNLLQYRHVCPATVEDPIDLGDEILENVINAYKKSDKMSVSFLFTKTNE